MTLHTSTGKPTKAQQARFERIKECGCILCRRYLHVYEPPEIHHLTDCGRRRGHDFTVGLCPWHHRGVSILPVQMAELAMGPSLARGAKPFRAHWGSDDELLDEQNRLIGVVA